MTENTKMVLYPILAVMAVCAMTEFAIWHRTRLVPRPLPLYTNAEQLNIDFNRGFTTLLNCGYFRHTYPKYRKELFKHTEVFFAYSNDSYIKPYYAITVRSENTIYLSDAFFQVKDANSREGILAHEMLHIVGMPPHKKDIMQGDDRIGDAIYTVEAKCFHPDQKWEDIP